MSEKVKQSSFVEAELSGFSTSANAYIPGFISGTTNVKIPASDFIAPIQSISVDDEPITPDVNGNVNITIPSSEGNIVYLYWDHATNLYNEIVALRNDGKTVFLNTHNGYTAIPMDDNPEGGRLCYMYMPASSYIIYLEFYPGGTPGWLETTTNISTLTMTELTSADSAATVWSRVNDNTLSFYTDEYNNRCIFNHKDGDSIYMYNLNPQSNNEKTSPLGYVFKRTGQEGSYTYTREKIKLTGYPIIIYAQTNSDVNPTQKQNRVAICRLDKYHNEPGFTDNLCEFLVQLYTGATPNGNANSSLSVHVLASASEDGGPYNVDMRITANNNWDLFNAKPTIALYDTRTGNDGVIVFFGLTDNTGNNWVDFEQTDVTITMLTPVPVLLGNTDRASDFSTYHTYVSPDYYIIPYSDSAEDICTKYNNNSNRIVYLQSESVFYKLIDDYIDNVGKKQTLKFSATTGAVEFNDGGFTRVITVVRDFSTTPNTYTKTIDTYAYPIEHIIDTATDGTNYVKRVKVCEIKNNDSSFPFKDPEFIIHGYTGATPNGNAYSSFSMHVLISGIANGFGDYINVKCKMLANCNWDMVTAIPTIAIDDRDSAFVVYFGLINNNAWQRFEDTDIKIINLNNTIKILGTTDNSSTISGLIKYKPLVEDSIWGHFLNNSTWVTIDDTDWKEMTFESRPEGEIGELVNNRITLPAGLYRFSLETAIRRASAAGTSTTFHGYEKIELQIKYGTSTLREETFAFNCVPYQIDMTEWSGGIFKLVSDGEIKINVRHSPDSGNIPIDSNSRIKVSHVFINKIS